MFGLLLMPQHMLQLKDDTARCEEDEAEKKIKLKECVSITTSGRTHARAEWAHGEILSRAKRPGYVVSSPAVQHNTAALCHALDT